MATRKQNLRPNDGVAWYDLYDISAGIDDMEAEIVGGNDTEIVKAVWLGSGAITLSNYTNFPVGSTIVDTQAKKIHMLGSAGWVSTAALT